MNIMYRRSVTNYFSIHKLVEFRKYLLKQITFQRSIWQLHYFVVLRRKDLKEDLYNHNLIFLIFLIFPLSIVTVSTFFLLKV